MEVLHTDVIVIGAGVIGLASARALARAGREVILLEAEPMIAVHTSSRNSEVIHAGIYYAEGSQKAHLCVEGRRQLYAYLDKHGVAYNRCGKLVVAHAEEASGLESILERAQQNGVEGLSLISGAEARAMEPALSPDIHAALKSEVSGIFDSHAYFLALQGEFEEAGGMIAFNTPVISGEVLTNGVVLQTGGDMPAKITARAVINAAGHNSVSVAHTIEGPHQSQIPKPYFVKGSYFSVVGRTPFSRLIYPMPGTASLGLHLTVDLAGRGKVGPDAEWLTEEARAPFDYQVNPDRAAHFYASVRRYWPSLAEGALAPDYAGVRPKLVGPGEPSGDFLFDMHSPSLLNLYGIESPGLTSSLAIADHIKSLMMSV